MNDQAQQTAPKPPVGSITASFDPKEMKRVSDFLSAYRKHKKRSAQVRIQFD